MTIIADSGATKCTWIVGDGATAKSLRTQGINAMQHSEAQIREALDELPPCANIERLYFYGAGCGANFPDASARLQTLLQGHFPTAQIELHSDLEAAARAIGGRGEGIACILGTGANSCHYRAGEVIDNVPPLGYILGDEGSGAALGKAIINSVFKRHIPLREELLSFCGMTYEQLIRRVYGEASASRFLASFAPFIAEHLAREDVRKMVANCLRDFARRNLSRYPAGLPVGFIGGVAAHFAPLLREVIEGEGYTITTIVESPAEGLIKYHYGA